MAPPLAGPACLALLTVSLATAGSVPSPGAVALFAVGTVAVAAGALTVGAGGMGAGFAALLLVAGGAVLPLVGAPPYGLGVGASEEREAPVSAPGEW